MKLTRLRTAALACGPCAPMACTSTALAADVKATMIIYLDPSVQFFNPVVKGAQDAAAQFGVDLDVQYANNDPVRQNDLIESATASGVDGIAVAISSSDAFDESICAAVKAGIIVIGFNNDDLDGAKGNCRQAYVGMDELASGYELGNRMIKEFGLKSGDVVFNPREIPEASFAVARGGGIEKAMTENGIKVETVRAGLDPAEAQNIIAQFLIANPNVKALFGTGSVTSTVGAGAIKDAGVRHSIRWFRPCGRDRKRGGIRRDVRDHGPAALSAGLLPDRPDRACQEIRADTDRHRHGSGRLPRQVAHRFGQAADRQLPLTVFRGRPAGAPGRFPRSPERSSARP